MTQYYIPFMWDNQDSTLNQENSNIIKLPDNLEQLKAIWLNHQDTLKKQLIQHSETLDFHYDSEKDEFINLNIVGGVDISFFRGDATKAIASLAVLSYPKLELLHLHTAPVKLTIPYLPGFLAFREATPLLELLEKHRRECPQLKIQILFVDGNGMFHPRQFGLACHLGVLANLPTIGIGKNFLVMENEPDLKQLLVQEPKEKELPYVELRGRTGLLYGAALYNKSRKNPIFISIGHRISLVDAVRIAAKCSKFRVPEPVRQADVKSREMIRGKWSVSVIIH